ncbi:MAG: DUF4383 domain-containing protein [Chloroflexaceae bacterium]|nr:DUF4383 domain-containing protein [Chloroflexaceae bacterium]
MQERYCALGLGVLFTLLGILGFFPGFITVPDTAVAYVPDVLAPGVYASGFSYLFGLFPTNLFHNLVHLTVGLLGLAAGTNLVTARAYNRAFAVAYLAIAVMGLLPVTKTTFGLMPIFGNNVWLNALTGAIAGYFGFVKPGRTPDLGASPS